MELTEDEIEMLKKAAVDRAFYLGGDQPEWEQLYDKLKNAVEVHVIKRCSGCKGAGMVQMGREAATCTECGGDGHA